jgi:putative SOS response-associated peptidase YedK
MCGRYGTGHTKQEVAEAFHAEKVFAEPMPPDYNVAPTTFHPVVRDEKDEPGRELVLMRWGLIPFFAKSLADWKGVTTINARAETVATSATYRKPFQSRRCIVPADWFYEWKTTDNGTKKPYVIRLKSGAPLAFAGLWDAWHDKANDTWLQSYTIITTEANELMSAIHSRMPVILQPKDWARWLDRTPSEQPPIDLLRPYDSDVMEMYASNPAVGSVKNNGPEMLEPAKGPPSDTTPGLPLNSE